MQNRQTTTELGGAATLCDVVAALYLKSPDEDLLAGVDAFCGAAGDVASEPLAAVTQEYYDLFFNPASGRHLPPFESFARERRYWGENALQVGSIYREADFEPAELLADVHWRRQPMPDHIGFEFAFLSALLRSAEAQPAEREALLATAGDFLDGHLRLWADDYGTRLAENAQTSLYRLLGRLTRKAAEISFAHGERQ
jgi:TorA maturation chaperone TorD